MIRPIRNGDDGMMPLPLVFEELRLKAYRPPPAADGGPHFMFDGNVLTHLEFKYFLANVQEPVIVAGGAAEEPNLVHLFDSYDAFESWGVGTHFARQFNRIDEMIHVNRNSDERQAGVGIISNVSMENNMLEPAVWSGAPTVASLFEGRDFRGREINLGTGVVSDLGDLEFSAVMSSVRVRGVLMLADRVNFNGYRFYITGHPFIEVPDMKRWGFDKAARSAVLI